MFANSTGPLPGMDQGFPDTCLTQVGPAVVPIPYPNIGMKATVLPATAAIKVLTSFFPTHNIASTTPMTNGDQAGSAPGGVASGMIMGQARNITCSVKVLMGGMPATRTLDTTIQNLSNAPGTTLVPSQVKSLILS